LEYLRIYEKQIKDISSLKSFINLKTLIVAGTKVSDEQIVELQKALPDLEIKK